MHENSPVHRGRAHLETGYTRPPRHRNIFFQRVGAAHGKGRVVAREPVRAHDPRERPDQGAGDGVAPQVVDDETARGDPLHLAQRPHASLRPEVVKGERAKRDVEGPVFVGQGQGVRRRDGDFRVSLGQAAREGEDAGMVVRGDDLDATACESSQPRPPHNRARDVRPARGDVEDTNRSRIRREGGDEGTERTQNGGRAAQEPVDARDVRERSLEIPVGMIDGIDELGSLPARKGNESG